MGDYIEVLCSDGKAFKGVLMDFTDDYLVLTPGLAFAFGGIDRVEKA